MLDILIMMGVALFVIEGFMLLFWVIYLIQRNVSIMDIAWGLSFVITAAIYFTLGNGYIWRRALVLTIVSAWSLRLVYYVIQRFQVSREDPRHLLVLHSWKDNFLVRIEPLFARVLILFLLQGLIVIILSLPFALMSHNRDPFFLPIEVFGLLIWMAGMVGEAVADRQLYLFKRNPANETRVFDEGLWKYSRHPNYFFEWIIWIGYFVMALASSGGWLAIISPLLILYLLLNVSGIPIAEAESLRTKGDAYRDYQARTNAFFPWFKF